MEPRQRLNASAVQPLDPQSKAAHLKRGPPTRRPLQRRITASLPYILVSLFTAYYARLDVVLRDSEEKLNWSFLYLAAVSAVLVVGVFFYLSLYLPLKTGRPVDLTKWEKTAPLAIPVATGLGCFSGLTAVIGLWPAYGVWSTLLLFIEFLGFVSIVTIF